MVYDKPCIFYEDKGGKEFWEKVLKRQFHSLKFIWEEGFEHPVIASYSFEPHELANRFYWTTGNRAHWLDLYAVEPTHWLPLPTPPENG